MVDSIAQIEMGKSWKTGFLRLARTIDDRKVKNKKKKRNELGEKIACFAMYLSANNFILICFLSDRKSVCYRIVFFSVRSLLRRNFDQGENDTVQK